MIEQELTDTIDSLDLRDAFWTKEREARQQVYSNWVANRYAFATPLSAPKQVLLRTAATARSTSCDGTGIEACKKWQEERGKRLRF